MSAIDAFCGSAEFYDELYREKDYDAEAAFVAGAIRAASPAARSVLDLGCGTGVHALALARAGFSVHGVDRSEDMLARARSRLAAGDGRVTFEAGDARSYEAGRAFDAVVSLFHVVSYQVEDDDLRAAFATMRRSVADGGVVLFDFWHGPGVEADPPEPRTKRVEAGGYVLTREAQPTHDPARRVVEVAYRFRVEDRATGEERSFREVHAMRYLYEPELRDLLAEAGLALEHCGAWLEERAPGARDWNAYVRASPVEGAA